MVKNMQIKYTEMNVVWAILSLCFVQVEKNLLFFFLMRQKNIESIKIKDFTLNHKFLSFVKFNLAAKYSKSLSSLI